MPLFEFEILEKKAFVYLWSKVNKNKNKIDDFFLQIYDINLLILKLFIYY